MKEYGAFVDIGLARPALLHKSEVNVRLIPPPVNYCHVLPSQRQPQASKFTSLHAPSTLAPLLQGHGNGRLVDVWHNYYQQTHGRQHRRAGTYCRC